jgi:hypothetical protein
MRLLLRPVFALGRPLKLLLKKGVQLTIFSIVGAALLFVLDLTLLRDKQHPER